MAANLKYTEVYIFMVLRIKYTKEIRNYKTLNQVKNQYFITL